MKIQVRFLFAVCLICSATALTGAQEQQGATQPWMKFEKELGMQTTYTVDMEMQMMGMNMKSRTYRDGGKTRTEMVMPMLNIKTVALDIPGGSYSLFPEKKKYVVNTEVQQALAATAAPRVEELGTESYNGEDCIKRRVTMVQQGVAGEMIMLFSPRQKNMPVKITMNAVMEGKPVQSVVLFKNYDFSKPADGLFVLPSDYVRASGMQEIMMESMPDMDAMMKQMQQMVPAEQN